MGSRDFTTYLCFCHVESRKIGHALAKLEISDAHDDGKPKVVTKRSNFRPALVVPLAKMSAVRALQASRAFSRVVLPVHSRALSRIAVRAPQVLARVGPSSVRAFSVTTRVQDGKYSPTLRCLRVF